MKNMSNWFLRLALLYLIAGVSRGLVVAATHNHSMRPVHANLSFLWFVLLSFFGLFYRTFPPAVESLLAQMRFGIYLPAHFIQIFTGVDTQPLNQYWRRHLYRSAWRSSALLQVSEGSLQNPVRRKCQLSVVATGFAAVVT